MEKLNNLEQYKALLEESREKWGKLDTNCFWMSKDVKQYLEQSRLSFECHEAALLFYVDEDRYYNLLYYKQKEKPFPNISQNKPVLIEEMDANGRRSEYIKNNEPLLLNAGFLKTAFNHHFMLDLSTDFSSLELSLKERLAQISKEGLSLSWCNDEKTAEQSIKLWKHSLEDTDIPLDHFWFSKIESDRVICVVNQDGDVCATDWLRSANCNVESRHTVTHPNYYRRGLASILLIAGLLDAKQNGMHRAYTWVEQNNQKSILLHQKLGFIMSGKTSTQYILK